MSSRSVQTSGAVRSYATTATIANLEPLMLFVQESCADLGIDGSNAFTVRLAVEEVCTNLMTHGRGPGEAGPIEVSIESAPGRIVVTIHDQGARFAPSEAPQPDLESDAEDRRIGGLGVYLVQQMMDEVDYQSSAEGNTLRLVKYSG